MGRIRSFSMGVALAAAVGLFAAPTANAQDLDGGASLLLPSGTLLMPFDNTSNHASFQIVTRLGAGEVAGAPIATHWSFWADDCRHLVDVFVCLTANDTKVMDPAAVQGEIQSPNPPTNNGIGSITDLTGERGLVTVTAYVADLGLSGLECKVTDFEAVLPDELVGGWVIANTSTNAAFGADAIGLAPDALPDAGLISDTGPGIFVQTFNPQSLGDSEIIVLSAEIFAGNGLFKDVEIGPIQRDLPDGNHVCCNVTFTDNLEVTTSLPDLCFKCVGFNPILTLATSSDDPIIPPSTTINAPGFVKLRNCESFDPTDGPIPLVDSVDEQFLFAVHGQAIGPFGAAIYGKYTGEPF